MTAQMTQEPSYQCIVKNGSLVKIEATAAVVVIDGVEWTSKVPDCKEDEAEIKACIQKNF